MSELLGKVADTTAIAPEPLRLGFVRGIAPAKWARRWAEAVPGVPLELVPLRATASPKPAAATRVDVVLERCSPGATPPGVAVGGNPDDEPTRHGVHLYTESVALVVEPAHELADETAVDRDALDLLDLLAHPDHDAAWPAAAPWNDPAWAPADAEAAMELVATGAGAILLPLPLARHLAGKRTHAVIPVHDPDPLPGTEIWATWARERDGADVQQLVGVMRGRTARSDRPGIGHVDPPAKARGQRDPGAARATGKPVSANKKTPPKNSRGAQLAAAQAKREAAKRARQQQKRKGR